MIDSPNWFEVANVDEIASPALLLYPDRARENVRRMIQIAGGAGRLRPHIKTHKLAELVRMQIEEGIGKFKCATIAEAELAANAGARDVLIAYPLVGPNVRRLLELAKRFPKTKFACLADDTEAIRAISKAFSSASMEVEVFLDVDCGQHRTGIGFGPPALELYRLIATLPGLKAGGLHVYDGHVHEADLAKRTVLCREAFGPADELRRDLLAAGLPVPRVVAGGTPTFPIHAENASVECSPGTCVLWDFGYSSKFADLNFLHAGLVLTRVVSKPGPNRLCLDLGHKAIGAENPPPRVSFLNLMEAKPISHSEEHMVVESPAAAKLAAGHCLYGVPAHICPTVALYAEASVIGNGRAAQTWRVLARDRRLTI